MIQNYLKDNLTNIKTFTIKNRLTIFILKKVIIDFITGKKPALVYRDILMMFKITQ